MRLKDYIQSNKRGKEANQLEREALNDPFMQDALDGFDTVTGNHVEIIEQLEKKYTKSSVAPQTNRRVFLYRSIAASILLLIGFGTYLFLEGNKDDIPVIAKVQPIENESIIPIDSSEPLPAPIIEESRQKPLIAQATKKIIPLTSSSTVPNINESASSSQLLADESFAEIMVNKEQEEQNYETQDIKSLDLDTERTVALQSNNLALLDEVVVIGYGTQRKSSVLGAVAAISKSESQHTFGEKEFRVYSQERADKNVCSGKGATVKVSFFIDETGKPSQIEFKSFSCEEAKKEIENLLSSSPAWTKTNRKVTMTIKW